MQCSISQDAKDLRCTEHHRYMTCVEKRVVKKKTTRRRRQGWKAIIPMDVVNNHSVYELPKVKKLPWHSPECDCVICSK